MGCNIGGGGGGGGARFGLSRVAMLAPLLHATMSCSKAQPKSAKGRGGEEGAWQVHVLAGDRHESEHRRMVRWAITEDGYVV